MRADNLCRPIALNLLCTGIPSLDTAFRVEHEDRVVLDFLHHQPEPLFTFPQRLCRLFTLGDVADEANKQAPATLGKFAKRDFQWGLSAGLVEAGELYPLPRDMPFPSSQVAFHPRLIPAPKGLGHEQGEALAEELGASVAKDPLDGGVDEDDCTLRIDRHDGIGGSLGDNPIALFALPQRFARFDQLRGPRLDLLLQLVVSLVPRRLHPLALGDVTGDHIQTGCPSVRPEVRNV